MARLPVFACVLLAATSIAAAQTLPTLRLENSQDRESYRRIVRVLEGTLVSVAWENAPLAEAVKDLARRTGLNVLLATALKGREEEPVSLVLNDVRAITVVKVLEESLKITFQHRHGVLMATTEEDALKQSMSLEIYDIRDMLYVPPDFPAPSQLGIRPGPPPEPEPEEPRESKSPDLLVELIKTTTGATTWEVEGATITVDKGLLFVRHAPHIQAKVRQLVVQLRAFY